MATLYKPTVVEQNSAKRTHMSRVDEYQILNGHYVRLRSAKVRRQPTAGESYQPTPVPNRSRSMELKRTTSELTITKMSRNLSPGSRSGAKPMSTMEIRRIQLSQSMTSLRPQHRPAGANPRLSKSFAYGPYAKHRTLSNQYERRFLDVDLMDKNFFMFNQPRRRNNPRLLLFNVQRSKVAKMSRVYQPPVNRRTLADDLNATWHPGVANGFGDDGGLMLEHSGSAQSSKFFQQRERLSPNMFNVRRPSRGDLQQFVKPALSKQEQDEISAWNFLRDVTENLIIAQTYSDTALCQIFQNSINNWKTRLPESKLKTLVSKLLDDLCIAKDGALAIFQEPKDFVKPIIVEPPDYEPSYSYSEHDDDVIDEDRKSIQISAYESADADNERNSSSETSVEEKNRKISKNRKDTATPEAKKRTDQKPPSSTKEKRNAWTESKQKTAKNKNAKLSVAVESENEDIEEEIANENDGIVEEVVSDNDDNETAVPLKVMVVSDKKSKKSPILEELYEESVADDSPAHSPVMAVKSFKEQELSKSDSMFENDKSSAATMGEVSDIDDDDDEASVVPTRKAPVAFEMNKFQQKILTSGGGKPPTGGVSPDDDVPPDRMLTKPTKVLKNKQKRRRYSWESSQSDDDDDEEEEKPVKQTAKEKEPKNVERVPFQTKIDKTMQEINEKPTPNLGNRENTVGSLANEGTESLSQQSSQKPKERRRWWPSKESTAAVVQSAEENAQKSFAKPADDELPLSAGSAEKNLIADEVRKKREPFLQKFADARPSVSDRSNDSEEKSTGRKLSPKDTADDNSPKPVVQRSPPVPAKRPSLSSTVNSQQRRPTDAAESTASVDHRHGGGDSTDDAEADGVFDVPEDAALRGDYGGRRLSQLISQMAAEPADNNGISNKNPVKRAAAVLTRSPRIVADDGSVPSSDKSFSDANGQQQRRRSSSAINANQQQQRQTSVIYESDETPANGVDSKVGQQPSSSKRGSEPEEDDSAPDGGTESSGGEASQEDAEMAKSTRVLKNALNALALAATSDESDKDEQQR